jgi:hypothetical protein
MTIKAQDDQPHRTADIARPLAVGGDAQSRSFLATETLGPPFSQRDVAGDI